MFDHRIAVAERSHDVTELLGGLFGDSRERDDVHHASQAVTLGMAKRKRQGRERLAAAGRDGERKQPGVPHGRGAANLTHHGPFDVDGRRRTLHSRHVRVKAGLHPLKHVRRPGGPRSSPFRIHEPLGVQKVGIDEAREHHAHEECHAERIASSQSRRHERWRLEGWGTDDGLRRVAPRLDRLREAGLQA